MSAESEADRPRPRAFPAAPRRPATRRAEPTYPARASRSLAAFFLERSISYVVPSSPKVTVSSALPPSRSSSRTTCTLCAIDDNPSCTRHRAQSPAELFAPDLYRTNHPLVILRPDCSAKWRGPVVTLRIQIAPKNAVGRGCAMQHPRPGAGNRGESLRPEQREQNRLPDTG